MSYCVYVPLLVCGLLAAASRPVAARVSPAAGAWMLTGAGLAGAVTSAWASLLLAATLLDDVPWLPDRLRLLDPVPAPVAVAAAAVLGGGGYRLARSSWLAAATVRRLRRLCRAATPAGNLVVADWDRPQAVAVPGRLPRRSGYILVTAGMLRVLDHSERRAMLAHEQAHLDGGHHWLCVLAGAAAAVNPLLVPLRSAVRYLVERAADETAAAAVASRRLTARSLARAALAGHGRPAGPPAFDQHCVLRRVEALRRHPPRQRALPALLLLAVAGAGLLSTADATSDFIRLALRQFH
ncbi:M48 family metalloprotease [Dactylosporangium sp. CA-139114]|uniref:M48 family metalloprotease n=1 Tax=Dactylosporangium sp. CA-139114 TaxID=3239931 RepID=UPI003D980A1A